MPTLNVNGKRHDAEDVKEEDHFRLVRIDGRDVKVELLKELSYDPLILLVRTGGQVLRVSVEKKDAPDHFEVRLNGKPFSVTLEKTEAYGPGSGITVSEGPVVVNAPMAGKIASLRTSIGTTAAEGQTLLVLEAMKMENEIASPKTGIVKEIYVEPGASVKAGDKLCLVE